MRNSQYTDPYLAMTANPETRYTLSTYLKYTLRGNATNYSGDYERALLNSLTRLVDKGLAEIVPSVRGGVAWIRREATMAPPQRVRVNQANRPAPA